MKTQSQDEDITLSEHQSVHSTNESTNSFFLTTKQITTKTRDLFVCLFRNSLEYSNFQETIFSAWDSGKHTLIGFLLGLTLNFLAIPILRSSSQKRKRTPGFVVGCFCSFFIFFTLMLVMAAYVRHDTVARSEFEQAQKKSSQKKIYKPQKFSVYFSGLMGRFRSFLKDDLCFWCPKQVKTVRVVTKKENKVEQRVKKSIERFNKLKARFAANYSF